jgi:DNA topoisomerase IA
VKFLRLLEVLLFEGFLKVYLEGHDDDEEEQEGMLPALKVNEKLAITILQPQNDIQDHCTLYRSIFS